MHAILAADIPPTVNEIAALIDAPQPSVSRCLARLDRMGLIERTPGLNRRQHISPSLSARELIE